MGAWASYGLGSESADLPAYVVLLDKNTDSQAQPVYSRLWGAGFLPSNHQGVKLRASGDPVLFLQDPTGASRSDHRRLLDHLAALNSERHQTTGDPEINTRIAAVRNGLPHADVRARADRHLQRIRNPPSTSTAPMPKSPAPTPPTACSPAASPSAASASSRSTTAAGTTTATCPAATRSVAKDSRPGLRRPHPGPQTTRHARRHPRRLGRRVRPHRLQTRRLARQLRPRPPPALLLHLARRRRHQRRPPLRRNRRLLLQHPRPRKPGVHVHDLNATILHRLGIDHERLTYFFQGRDYRLTDVHGKVVKAILT